MYLTKSRLQKVDCDCTMNYVGFCCVLQSQFFSDPDAYVST